MEPVSVFKIITANFVNIYNNNVQIIVNLMVNNKEIAI
jgi:hypothetical protein